jgi:outer membrane lipoprotein SlyB
MVKRFTLISTAGLLFCSMLSSSLPAVAQPNHNDSRFYKGANRGVHGGNYGQGNYQEHHYDQNRNQGGIGPGKGALIGGAAGAVLGAAFGGGVKGSLITGAAGAGIGAVIGQSAQNNRQQNNYYHR